MSDLGIGGIALVMVVGLLFAGIGGYLWVDQTEAIESYEQVEATVVSSEVAVDRDVSDEGGPTYAPGITYEYTVDGETYRSSNVYPGTGTTYKSDRGWARSTVEDHPEGERVTAYYDPENPSNAFLIKKRQFVGPVLFGGIGSVAFLVGAGGLLKKTTSLLD